MTKRCRFFFLVWFGWIMLGAAGAAETQVLTFTVRAGAHDRRDSLIKCVVPLDRLGPAVRDLLRTTRDCDIDLAVTDLDPPVGAIPRAAKAELRRLDNGMVQILWFLRTPLAAGQEAHLAVFAKTWAAGFDTTCVTEVTTDRRILVDRRVSPQETRPVLIYNAGPTKPPPMQSDPNLLRDAYIHPAYAPSGALVTGDFSSFHPHHRGIFLAYVHTKWADLEPDFWNIQLGTGRIIADGLEPPTTGTVVCRFSTRHRWEALRKTATGVNSEVALRERWEVEIYAVPGSPYYLFDLTSTQQAEGHPLEILPHRYGGMAFRSAEPSVVGPIDVLTAEGRHRLEGDQKPTRWVDLTGPTAPGSPKYAGVLIADHPTNSGYPTVVRIHPITLPFFSYVPAHDKSLTIATDQPTRFRYRIMLHDGHPDPALNDRIAADFAEPPTVELNEN